MFQLRQVVKIPRQRKVGTIVGRTHEATPRYDVRIGSDHKIIRDMVASDLQALDKPAA